MQVAYEYIACQQQSHGVLILSEFAGAGASLFRVSAVSLGEGVGSWASAADGGSTRSGSGEQAEEGAGRRRAALGLVLLALLSPESPLPGQKSLSSAQERSDRTSGIRRDALRLLWRQRAPRPMPWQGRRRTAAAVTGGRHRYAVAQPASSTGPQQTVTSSRRNRVLTTPLAPRAAHSLNGSLIVNPWNTAETGEAIHQALTMAPDEREEAHRKLFRYVSQYTASHWVSPVVRAVFRGGVEPGERVALTLTPSRCTLDRRGPSLLWSLSRRRRRAIRAARSTRAESSSPSTRRRRLPGSRRSGTRGRRLRPHRVPARVRIVQVFLRPLPHSLDPQHALGRSREAGTAPPPLARTSPSRSSSLCLAHPRRFLWASPVALNPAHLHPSLLRSRPS